MDDFYIVFFTCGCFGDFVAVSVAAFGEDVWLDEGESFALGLIYVDAFYDFVDEFERADNLHTFLAGHKFVSFLLNSLAGVVDDYDEFVTEGFGLFHEFDVSYVERIEIAARYDSHRFFWFHGFSFRRFSF